MNRMIQQFVKRVDFTELGAAEAIAGGVAEIERAQAEAVLALAESHGFDLDVRVPDPERRKNTLLEGANELSTGDGIEWYIKFAYGNRLDNPEKAAEFRDLDPGSWTDEEREQSAEFIRETFGVELDWFVSEIVGLDQRQVVRELFTANLEAIEFAIRDAAEQEPDPPSDE